jgi:peptidoglycan hydrolase-like protein with peptidoglycan-binding domain
MKWLFAFILLAFPIMPSRATPQAPATSQKLTSSAKHAPNRARYAKRKRSSRKAGPSYQSHPDPQRYQEIQKALADRGYFKGAVNGQWGDDSVDALKRFQADQKLSADGKINSLSLIGLGLGPKHNGSSVAPADRTATPAIQPSPVAEPVAPSSGEPPR